MKEENGRSSIFEIDAESISRAVSKAAEMLASGRRPVEVAPSIMCRGFDEDASRTVMDMARTRKRALEKYPRGDELFFTSEGLRWGTPDTAAKHCAARLGRELVMDLTCGQGGQVMALASECDHVIGVDIDPLNCLVAGLNMRALNIDNVEIIQADSLSKEVVDRAQNGCAVFCDPARPQGSTERELSELKPDPRKVLEAYDGKPSGMCFEVPPYLSLSKVPFECEAEYVSIEDRLNRLNLYLGDLKSSQRSAVILPEGAVLSGTPKAPPPELCPLEEGDMLYEVDPSVSMSGLTSELVGSVGGRISVISLDARRMLASSSEMVRSPFLKKAYRLLRITANEGSLIEDLRSLGAGSVTLRFKIAPEDYWSRRKAIEARLEGDRKVQVFERGGYLIVERVGTAPMVPSGREASGLN